MEFSQPLDISESAIEGLLVVNLSVHGDNRGWFKENWQRSKMRELGLPDFGPIQNNISYNAQAGVTRGLHAEPWDKFVSVASGSVFGAWCDLRADSPTFGKVFTTVITPDIAVFVPRGVANGFQALEPTAYTYLVNEHWSPTADYSFVNLSDPNLGIQWPIPLDQAELSEKDKNHPMLADAVAVKPRKILVTGGSGQLARALGAVLPNAVVVSRREFDITSGYKKLSQSFAWPEFSAIINAAAFTAVDEAETAVGRREAWAANATAVGDLARIAAENKLKFVHVSSEYVFDGSVTSHTEDELLSPLGVYGQSKAAGDIAAMTAPMHYVVRTSWVIGDGKNFVRTMMNLAESNVEPRVVNDQVGRPTFANELALAIQFLLNSEAEYGVYNFSSSGEVVSWADLAREVYALMGKQRSMVAPITTEEYFEGKSGIAARPPISTLSLEKIKSIGFEPRDWRESLRQYLVELKG